MHNLIFSFCLFYTRLLNILPCEISAHNICTFFISLDRVRYVNKILHLLEVNLSCVTLASSKYMPRLFLFHYHFFLNMPSFSCSPLGTKTTWNVLWHLDKSVYRHYPQHQMVHGWVNQTTSLKMSKLSMRRRLTSNMSRIHQIFPKVWTL